MDGLAQRLSLVRESISSKCSELNRAEPTLIVVTKNHPVDLAVDLIGLGETQFGENRVQEGELKAAQLSEALPDARVDWHLIGQLQTNKVKAALSFSNTIHSLDRSSLLLEIVKRAIGRSKPLDVFIQVNLTDDANRGGVLPVDLEKFATQVLEHESLNLLGLMAVATLEQAPQRDFELVSKLSEKVRSISVTANQLSIGMSGDYLTALEFGATHLRIGTAITGNRNY